METNVIYNEDCLDGMKKLPDKCIDLVMTDPPFNFIATGGGLFKKRGNLQRIDDSFGTDFKPEIYLNEICRIMKLFNGYFFCSKNLVENYLRWAREKGFGFNILTWHKLNPIPCNHNTFLPDTEYLIYIRESRAPFNNGLTFNLYTKFTITKVEKLDGHPTPKPIKLFRWLVKNATKEGDIVLDPFMGSGTTALACKQLNRRWVGFEISPEYCKIIEKRLSQKIMTGFFETLTPSQSEGDIMCKR